MVGVGESLRCLAQRTGFNIRTIGRWVKRTLHRAPQIHPLVRKVCQEFDPALAVHAGPAEGPVGARAELNRAIWWAKLWGELVVGPAKAREIGGWAVVNLLGPIQAGQLWL